MKKNECQGCLFPNSLRVCPCGPEAPTSLKAQSENMRAREIDIEIFWTAEPCALSHQDFIFEKWIYPHIYTEA